MTVMPYPTRHPFPSAADYIAHVVEARRTDRNYRPPETRDEYLVLADQFPELARRHRPSDPIWLDLMGLPRHYGLPVEPLDELWQERFLATLEDDEDFRAAVAHLIQGGQPS